MDYYFSIVIYVVTLALFFILYLKSHNVLIFVFGFIYCLYSLGFLYNGFTLDYFGYRVFVNFNSYHYFKLTILNIVCIWTLINERLFRIKGRKFPYEKDVAIMFIFIGLTALIHEMIIYGINFIFIDKTIRFSTTMVPNLFILSVDYILFIMVGVYALISFQKNYFASKVLYCLLILTALIGFLMGYRYYVALLFLIFFVKLVFKKNRAFLFIPLMFLLAFFGAELANNTFCYIKFYEWVHHSGYFSYVFNDFSVIPGEIKAIVTNTYLGFAEYANELKPDIGAYFIKAIPLSEHFYDFTTINSFYLTISQDMILQSGEGTAFSFYLENFTSYFIPLIIFFIVLLLNNFWRSPILELLSFYFILNIIRNGLIIGISSIKIGILIYFLVAFLIVSLKHIKPIISRLTKLSEINIKKSGAFL